MHKLFFLLLFFGISFNVIAQEEELPSEKSPEEQKWEEIIGEMETVFLEGNYHAAADKAKEALEWSIAHFDESHENVAGSWEYIGMCLHHAGELTEAETAMKKSIALVEKHHGKKHEIYITCSNNLGMLYQDLNQYDKALPIAIEVKNVTAEVFGKDHAYYGVFINNLGLLYERLGQKYKALESFEEAYEITVAQFGADHPKCGIRLNNLGTASIGIEDYEKAVEYLLKSKEIHVKEYGKDHPWYAQVLRNLGIAYSRLGNHEESYKVTMEALQIMENSVGKESPYYAMILRDLAARDLNLGNLDKALEFRKEILVIYENVYGPNHRDVGTALLHLAETYEAMGDIDQSAAYWEKCSQNLINRIDHQFDNFSESDQLSWFTVIAGVLDGLQGFTIRHPNYDALNIACFENSMMLKGVIQGNKKQLMASFAQDANEALQVQIEEWRSLKNTLSKQYALPIEKRLSEFDSLVLKTDELEGILANASAEFRTIKQKIGWKEVASQLRENEALIEFFHFWSRKENEVIHAAYILKKEYNAPKTVFLFKDKDLGKLKEVRRLYSFQKRGAQTNLNDLLWQPLKPYLENVESLYYTPSGQLHLINFGAIPISENACVADQFQLHCLGNTRQFLFSNKKEVFEKKALIFGGVEYDLDSTQLIAVHHLEKDKTLSAYALGDNYRSLRGDNWGYLKWTEEEANSIKKILTAGGIHVELQTGKGASEAIFKQIGKTQASPRILHLATHGYFFPDNFEEKEGSSTGFKTSEHPMIRSGLILSGGNYAWKGGALQEGQEDGILTAFEIADMNLRNTELVVLSACETGLGDIQGNEGVFGLQRAFKIAGAKYILMSLWQVPDQQTQHLMTTFYEEWMDGKTIPEAFQTAQQKMKEEYVNPYMWAGFVLIE